MLMEEKWISSLRRKRRQQELSETVVGTDMPCNS
jgi:hypothetical protein